MIEDFTADQITLNTSHTEYIKNTGPRTDEVSEGPESNTCVS
jgi:hypothetical protein